LSPGPGYCFDPPRSSRGQMRTLGSMQARRHGARVGVGALVAASRGCHCVTGSGSFLYEGDQGLMRELGTVWYFLAASSAPTKLHRQWPQMQLHLIASASCCESKRPVWAKTLDHRLCEIGTAMVTMPPSTKAYAPSWNPPVAQAFLKTHGEIRHQAGPAKPGLRLGLKAS